MEGDNKLTDDQLITRETIKLKFNEFKHLIKQIEYTKDFIE